MTRYFEAAAAGDAFESQGTECTTREAILHFASSAPAGVADPRWMKPRATRCPGERACERIGLKDCITIVRPSRRTLRVPLRMRYASDRTKKISHPEEAAERPSRRTHRARPSPI